MMLATTPSAEPAHRGAVRFTRRRYGHTTFTWAAVCDGEQWHDLGDPYPAIRWPTTMLLAEIGRVLDNTDLAGLTAEALATEQRVCTCTLHIADERGEAAEMARLERRLIAVADALARSARAS